jgi:hypothetical protein
MGKTQRKMKGRHKKGIEANLIASVLVFALLIYLLPLVISTPTGPTSINVTANETKGTTTGLMVNISGGRIATLNVTATVQNPHWKAFVGDINGKFTLDDGSSSTIYDWTLANVNGEVYATRTSGSVTWGSIVCANSTHIDSEDSSLEHMGTDNISSTFDGNNSQTYLIAGITIIPNQCRATNTYVNNLTQATEFEEILIYDGTNMIFTTGIEPNEQGFDGNNYDFQMIVPENANSTWAGVTAYYVYVEIG